MAGLPPASQLGGMLWWFCLYMQWAQAGFPVEAWPIGYQGQRRVGPGEISLLAYRSRELVVLQAAFHFSCPVVRYNQEPAYGRRVTNRLEAMQGFMCTTPRAATGDHKGSRSMHGLDKL